MAIAPRHLAARMRRVLAAALAVGLAWGGTAAGAASDRAVAVAAELAVEGSLTRLTLTLSRPVAARAFLLEGPDRVVVDLPEVNFQLAPDAAARRGGLVAAFRCGLFAIGRSRCVLDLAGPALVTHAETRDGPVAGVSLLVVELVRSDRAAFRRAAAQDREGPAVTGAIAPASRPHDPRPLVAIDAGHGGVDPGATAVSGALEKDIVLAFAETLRERLAASGRVRVAMIRDRDVFVPLDDRVRRARETGADLFISIHADSISSPSIRGATVYTGAERATDAESAGLADRENAADAVAGFVSPVRRGELADILLELTLRETRSFSHRIARNLMGDLGGVLRFSAQPHREAGFRVLRAPDIPSALVELGYLSNARDADLLLSESWRQRTAAAMASAIERFFEPRLAQRAAVSP